MAINSSTTALLHNLFSGTNEENPLKLICLKFIKNTSFNYIPPYLVRISATNSITEVSTLWAN